MAPLWSCLEKRLLFLKVEPCLSPPVLMPAGLLCIALRTTLQSGTKTVPKWGASCGHENGSTVEPFGSTFFFQCMSC